MPHPPALLTIVAGHKLRARAVLVAIRGCPASVATPDRKWSGLDSDGRQVSTSLRSALRGLDPLPLRVHGRELRRRRAAPFPVVAPVVVAAQAVEELLCLRRTGAESAPDAGPILPVA